MDDIFKVYVEQLRDGHIEKIAGEIPSTRLELDDADLRFVEPIELSGEAYLANDALVLNFDISGRAEIACTICNQPVQIDVEVTNFYHVEPLDEIKSGIYNFREILREDILLNTPQFAECDGNCSHREDVKKYLKPKKDQAEEEEQEGYHPFADLSFDADQETKKKKKSS